MLNTIHRKSSSTCIRCLWLNTDVKTYNHCTYNNNNTHVIQRYITTISQYKFNSTIQQNVQKQSTITSKNNARKQTKLLLIDATAIMYRCHYGSRKNPVYRYSDNYDISALQGYIQILGNLIKFYQPTHIASCIDRGNSWRKLLSTSYKIHRTATPVEMTYQLHYLSEITESYGIRALHSNTYEGDDIIGTLVRHSINNNIHNTIIYSPDKDMLQLVNSQYNIQLHRTGHKGSITVYNNEQSVYDYIGVYPNQIIDYLALAGGM